MASWGYSYWKGDFPLGPLIINNFKCNQLTKIIPFYYLLNILILVLENEGSPVW